MFKVGRDLKPGDTLQVMSSRRLITEIDKDRAVPKAWKDWCDAVWTIHFSDGTQITTFPDTRWEVY